MLAVSMPKLLTSAALVETATKCFATASSLPNFERAQARAECAFVIVSSVVNVFDAMMNSVSAASRSCVASAKSVASMFDTKRKHEVAAAVVPQRFVRHDRTQVRTADPDVHHVLMFLNSVHIGLPA
jgi:hypothetical protein